MINTHNSQAQRSSSMRSVAAKATVALGLAVAAVAAPVAASAHETVQPSQTATHYSKSSTGYSWNKSYKFENTNRYVYKRDKRTGKVWLFVKQRDGSYRLCKVLYCIPWCAVPAKDPKPEDNIEPFSAPGTQNIEPFSATTDGN